MQPAALLGLLAFATGINAAPAVGTSQGSVQTLKDNIKNVVVLVMENRSFDNLLGGQTLKGLENPIQSGPYCNPYDINDPSQGQACTAAKDYDSVANDPDHGVTGNNIEFYSQWAPNNTAIESGELQANMQGFMYEQARKYQSRVDKETLAKQVMNYYTKKQVPVLTELVQNYVTFNRWFSGVPGPTNPNRAYVTSGTSSGHGTNDASFDQNTHGHPQMSIFQALNETGHSWINYHDPKGGTGPDAAFYNWTYNSGNYNNIVPLANFYTDAAAGNLTDFSFLNPSCCGVGTNSMHPAGLVSDGEDLIRNVYQALRASPQWEQSMLILTFDESGGFHDHVPPPVVPAPDDLTYTSTAPNGESYTFPFNRLGGRIPTLLISPWVGKGVVEQNGTNADGENVSYSASSILRTLGHLWDFEPFTSRVDAAPSFEHLVTGTLRTNAPRDLPDPKAFK